MLWIFLQLWKPSSNSPHNLGTSHAPALGEFWLRHFGPVTSAEHKAMRPRPNCRDWFKDWWKLNLDETLRISSWNMYLSRNIGECFFEPILESLPSCAIDVKNDVILMLSGSKNEKRYPSSQFTQFTPSQPFHWDCVHHQMSNRITQQYEWHRETTGLAKHKQMTSSSQLRWYLWRHEPSPETFHLPQSS